VLATFTDALPDGSRAMIDDAMRSAKEIGSGLTLSSSSFPNEKSRVTHCVPWHGWQGVTNLDSGDVSR
jgi:hypothetical protein